MATVRIKVGDLKKAIEEAYGRPVYRRHANVRTRGYPRSANMVMPRGPDLGDEYYVNMAANAELDPSEDPYEQASNIMRNERMIGGLPPGFDYGLLVAAVKAEIDRLGRRTLESLGHQAYGSAARKLQDDTTNRAIALMMVSFEKQTGMNSHDYDFKVTPGGTVAKRKDMPMARAEYKFAGSKWQKLVGESALHEARPVTTRMPKSFAEFRKLLAKALKAVGGPKEAIELLADVGYEGNELDTVQNAWSIIEDEQNAEGPYGVYDVADYVHDAIIDFVSDIGTQGYDVAELARAVETYVTGERDNVTKVEAPTKLDVTSLTKKLAAVLQAAGLKVKVMTKSKGNIHVLQRDADPVIAAVEPMLTKLGFKKSAGAYSAAFTKESDSYPYRSVSVEIESEEDYVGMYIYGSA